MSYKKDAIKAFYKGNYDLAKTYFSLEYEKKQDNKILFLIMVCELAKSSKDEAFMILDLALSKINNKKSSKDLESILEALESDFSLDKEDFILTQDAINYSDFKEIIAQKGSFKLAFEDIMFSTRVLIDDKDDFFDFIGSLIDNNFIDMALRYIENAATLFVGDDRILSLIQEISEKKYENQSTK